MLETRKDNVMSVFERNMMGELNCFCQGHGKSEWKVLLLIIICNKIHRQLCWYIDSMNIVCTFLYAVFCDCHHHLGSSQGSEIPDYWNSHNCVRKKGSEWRLFVSHVFKLFIYKVQTAAISSVQCEMHAIDVSCFI